MNNPITEARSVALSLLNPSQRDLDHGLALHRDALVVESYSLGLHAPVDANALNCLADAGGSPLERQDAREGTLPAIRTFHAVSSSFRHDAA